MSKLPPITPTTDKTKSNFVGHDEACLPPEQCSTCSHGFKVYVCGLSALVPYVHVMSHPLHFEFYTARNMPRSYTSFAGNEGHVNIYIK